MNPSDWIRSRRPDGDAPLFSFIVVADTHVNERDGESTSPYDTNRHANERARWVFREIAAMEPPPRFVVHLGDIVHPVPSLPTYSEAVERFGEISAGLRVPLHLTPGNHDVGDKSVDWMPADPVRPEYLERYRRAFGSDFHGFDEPGFRFLVLNTLLLNSGLPDEQRQREWFEAQLDGAADRRVMVFMHYPPYIHGEDEPGNYDNIDEPGRGWLLSQLKRPMVEAVFAGHVHNFWFDRVGEAALYMLPSTAFLRHDFTEFYRIAPGVEFGRGDASKFGYFVVDVHRDGHVAYSVRTHGRRVARDEAATPVASRHLAHCRTSAFERVGVQLRHPWTESQQITATGGVQEFGRKWARNDYPLLALWEMGCRLLMVPELDWREAPSRRRMALAARMGQSFVVTAQKAPPAGLDAREAAAAGIVGWELNAMAPYFERASARLREARAASGVPVYWSRIHGPADSAYDGKHFSHFVKAGFMVPELAEYRDRFVALRRDGLIDGITVRVETGDDVLASLAAIDATLRDTGLRAIVSLKTATASIATEQADDVALLRRTVAAMLASRGADRLVLVFDTFMDVDRGYSPRHGFIDRRFDPRPAAVAFATMASLLSHVRIGDVRATADGGFAFTADARACVVAFPRDGDAGARALPDAGRSIDLTSGVPLETAWRTRPRDALPAAVLLMS